MDILIKYSPAGSFSFFNNCDRGDKVCELLAFEEILHVAFKVVLDIGGESVQRQSQ